MQEVTDELLNTKQILLMPLARKGLESQVCGRRRGSKFYNIPPTYQESILPTSLEFYPECGRLGWAGVPKGECEMKKSMLE